MSNRMVYTAYCSQCDWEFEDRSKMFVSTYSTAHSSMYGHQTDVVARVR